MARQHNDGAAAPGQGTPGLSRSDDAPGSRARQGDKQADPVIVQRSAPGCNAGPVPDIDAILGWLLAPSPPRVVALDEPFRAECNVCRCNRSLVADVMTALTWTSPSSGRRTGAVLHATVCEPCAKRVRQGDATACTRVEEVFKAKLLAHKGDLLQVMDDGAILLMKEDGTILRGVEI